MPDDRADPPAFPKGEKPDTPGDCGIVANYHGVIGIGREASVASARWQGIPPPAAKRRPACGLEGRTLSS